MRAVVRASVFTPTGIRACLRVLVRVRVCVCAYARVHAHVCVRMLT